MKRPPLFARAIAIILGVLAAAAPASMPLEAPSFATSVALSVATFGIAGLILAALWPAGGWRWGIWVIAPGLLLVSIGVLSSGQIERFLADDLPFLATGLAGACAGAIAGSRMRRDRTANIVD